VVEALLVLCTICPAIFWQSDVINDTTNDYVNERSFKT